IENGKYVPPKTQNGDLTWWCDLCDIGWVEEYGVIRRSKGSSRGTIVPFTQRYRPANIHSQFSLQHNTLHLNKCAPLYRTSFSVCLHLLFFPSPNTRRRG
ncbi:hypothetical protein GE21DRAFT_1214753, partial [Neurospora crassa]